ncbi:hypothetical protein CVT24_004573 [Panaeolus cyanescens]|uniref:Uncharacterized protein n=1 Tax=Panaeolus cyanescens TaxID=181874 RepID=A0A409VA49_9AGAR|nr:hypothetical protein CVT24_004573 [Panaeolus cyanescens]
MLWTSLLPLLTPILNEIEPGTLSNETLSKLHSICPEKLILAALDIIDRGNVIRYVTPWGHEEYQVLGASGNYSVLLDLTASPTVPLTCTCPAFVYSVLLAQTHLLVCHLVHKPQLNAHEISVQTHTRSPNCAAAEAMQRKTS